MSVPNLDWETDNSNFYFGFPQSALPNIRIEENERFFSYRFKYLVTLIQPLCAILSSVTDRVFKLPLNRPTKFQSPTLSLTFRCANIYLLMICSTCHMFRSHHTSSVYAVFFSSVLCTLSFIQLFYSSPSQTLASCPVLSVLETNFHTYTEKEIKPALD